jgi:mannose-6-phosphate isomerase-like protein (cupin superfamily)
VLTHRAGISSAVVGENAAVSAYTKTNIRELEDSALKYGLAPAMEARFARDALDCERSGLSLQRVGPNERQPWGHRHKDSEEVYVVVAGSGRANLDSEIVTLRQWDAVRVAPGTMRSFEAGPDGLEFLAFGAGTAGLDDVESEPGWWPS